MFEQAAVWFATMQGGSPSKADRQSLQVWLAADARHAEAYASVERLWRGSIELPDLRERHDVVRRAVTRRRIGKALVVATVGFGIWRVLETHPFADYQTATGERRAVTLADGSVVDLAADTRLSASLNPDARRLVLHEGEAFFTVAADSARPFTVEAGKGRTTAYGTAFGIEYRDGSAMIVVTEHAVGVALDGQSVQVAAGSAISYEGDKIGLVRRAEAELAWREGRLVFADALLGNVVAALNRWRSGRLVIMSNALAKRPVTLIVDLQRSDAIVSQLAEALPIRIVNVTSYLTLLFPAE